MQVALNASIFVITCAQTNSVPIADSELFRPIYKLLEGVWSGELRELLAELDKKSLFSSAMDVLTRPGSAFSQEAREATSLVVEQLLKDYRHEDFFRPLWEFYQSKIEVHNNPLLSEHLKQVMDDSVTDNYLSNLGPNDQVKSAEADECSYFGEVYSFESHDEEQVCRLEERDQEVLELLRFHKYEYGEGSPVPSLPHTRQSLCNTADRHNSIEYVEYSFASLISTFRDLNHRLIHCMFMLLATEVFDVMQIAHQALSDLYMGSKIKSKFHAVGATTSYCQMRPGVIRSMNFDFYVGEEAGEVAEYQFLSLLCSLHQTPWPETVDKHSGRLHDGSIYVDPKWPQLLLLGDHQQLRPLLKAEGLQGMLPYSLIRT